MSRIQSFEDLTVWQEAMKLAKMVYLSQRKLPREELYALGDQLRRAVVSIPSNIAEGFGRDTTKDYLHFLAIARGSLYEVRTQLQLAEQLGFLAMSDDLKRELTSVSRLLSALITKLRARSNPRLSAIQNPK